MEVEFFRYVMHLTSVVKGNCFRGWLVEALKATLPAGTVSGAPEIRAVKRIYEVEKKKNEASCVGAVRLSFGCRGISFDGPWIRTMILQK